MPGLLYLTRGGDLPTEKPNILLLSHPSDLPLAISTVADDVLTAIDAAVWYSDTGLDHISDVDLADMNLVILPVTALLLSDFSPVARILGIAAARMLPVLPILIEEISLVDFESRLGTVQLLDRRENLTVDYSRKLRDRLEELDVGSRVRETIAANLDATLFLSYRHIDRPLANRLMSAIHDVPELRDVAIWYDEQLTVGNDYNDEILTSVRTSDVFVLAVTPSLLEDGNYVMTEEYPTAVRAAVPILPVMMQATDITALRAKYEGIPDPISPEEIPTALPSILGDRLNLTNDTDPIHLYYVGLAYHLGISVEIDHARAVELLCQSAELGCPAAYRRLAAIYIFGNGVTACNETAITYYRKYLAACEGLYRADESSDDNLSLLINAYSLLFSALNIEEGEERLAIARVAVDHSLNLAKRTLSVKAFRLLVRALARLAEMYKERLDYAQASEIYTIALRQARKVYETTSSLEDLEQYISQLRAAASVKLSEDKPQEAVDLILTALRLLEDEGEHRHADDLRLRTLAARVYDTLSTVCDCLEDYDGSISACKKAIELYRGLLSYNKDSFYLSEIHILECSILESLILLDRFDDAEAQLALIIEMTADPDVSRDGVYRINHEIRDLVYRARIQIGRKDCKRAAETLKKAEEMAQSAGKDLWDYVYHRIHYAYKSLYYAMKKPHLADYHHAIMLETTTDNAISRGRPRDFERLSEIYSEISARARKDREMWKKYEQLAIDGGLEFYPDDSHLEREREVHINNLGINVLSQATAMIIILGFIFVEWYFKLFLNTPGQRLFVNAVTLLYAIGFVGELITYIILRSRRHLPYSALEVFKRTERLTGFLLRYRLFSLPPMIVAFIVTLIVGDAMPTIVSTVIFSVLYAFWVVDRIAAATDKSIARERSRAFWRISRLMPLDSKK